MPGIADYRIQQESSDRVRVLLAGNGGLPPDGAERVAGVLRQRLGNTMRVLVQQVPAIPPHPSGKHRYVLNLAAPAMPA